MMKRLELYGFMIVALYVVLMINKSSTFPQVDIFTYVILTVSSVSWLSYQLIKGRGLPESPLNAPIILFFGLAIVVNLLSERPRIGFEELWNIIMTYVGFLFILNMFQQRKQGIVISTVFLIVYVVVLAAFFQVFSSIFGLGLVRGAGQGWIEFINTDITFSWQRELRISLPFRASTILAGFTGSLILISLTWAVSVRNIAQRLILWLLTLSLIVILLLTQSRAGFLSVSLGLATFFVLNRIKSIDTSKLFTRQVVITGVGALAVLGIAIVVVLGISRGRQSGDSVRLDLWRSATTMVVNDPLTGVGTGQFGRIHRELWTYQNARSGMQTPDNLYLYLLSEYGILIIPIGIWVAWIIGRRWWDLRSSVTPDTIYWIRLNGMMATLITFLGHRAFDSIIWMQHAMLLAIIIVYCTTDVSKAPPRIFSKTNRLSTAFLGLVLVGYGIWNIGFIYPAYQHFRNSNQPEFDAQSEIQNALRLDPYLNLYTLQRTYLEGNVVLDNPTPENLEEAIDSYLVALSIEPTWDVGMVNLATLYEANNQPEQALIWLEEAYQFFRDSSAHIDWARIADENNLADDDAIITNYVRAMELVPYLPLADFWAETDLRQQALLTYSEQLSVDREYRLFQVHFPDRLESLVTENPQTAPEWWAVGEHALTVADDTELAHEAFTNAVDLNPNYGDYYASRARTYSNLEDAERDLQIAQFLFVLDEDLDTIRLNLTSDTDDIRQVAQPLVPPNYSEGSGFILALFDRHGEFIPYDPVR